MDWSFEHTPGQNLTRYSLQDDFYRFLVRDAPIAVYTCNKVGQLTFFNQAAADLWGTVPEIGKEVWREPWHIYDADGRPIPLAESPMVKTLREGKPFEGINLLVERPDGSKVAILVFCRPVFDKEQKLVGAHNTLVNIESKRNVESKQAFLSAIIASSDDAIISKDLNGIITSWNKGAERIFGYSEPEVVGKPITIIIPASRLHEEDHILSNIKSGNRIEHFETVRLHESGRLVPISLTVSPIRDSFGNIIGASKIARDISERMEAQKIIEEHNERLEMLNALGKTISEKLDSEAILQKVTDATTKITGAQFGAFFYNKVDETGESYTLFTLSGAPREAFEQFGVPRNTQVFHPTFSGQEVVRSDDITKDERYGKNPPHFGMPKGHLPVRSYLAVPVISNAGYVIGGLFFGHPQAGTFTAFHESIVTNIASQAAVALDNSRLFEEVKTLSAKKDEFIALASHELKTPLTTIKGYLQILHQHDVASPALLIERCLQQVERLYSLVEELLDVSRIEAGKLDLRMETFDFRELVLEVMDNFRYANKSHTIVFDDPGEPCPVRADRYRMEQVLINLLSNAIKYSPKADKVYLWLERSERFLKVTIRDEGIGINSSQKAKLFNRFYRAEEVSGVPGLGLGLYLTREIIVRHNGTVGVSSQPDKGSEFYFSLPLK